MFHDEVEPLVGNGKKLSSGFMQRRAPRAIEKGRGT